LKKLKDILYKVSLESVRGNTETEVNLLTFDSRQAVTNSLFVAIKGTVSDGHNYIETAINKGVKAIVCEILPEQFHEEVTYIQVSDSNEALAQKN